MVTALVVPDGAADPLGAGPTCLEQARTPTLDWLAARGSVQRVRTIPAGLPAGTEVGLPTLLGVVLAAPPSRGRLEAAAAGVPLADGQSAWRLDLVPPATPSAGLVAALARAVAPLGASVRPLRGHRLLLVGPQAWGDAPPGPHQTRVPLRRLARGVWAEVAASTAAAAAAAGSPARTWPWGRAGDPAELAALPGVAGRPLQAVAAGAAAGLARLLGATVVAAAPETGAGVLGDAPGSSVVLVHDPAPDDAGHARDRGAKVAALERFDRTVLAPLVAVARRRPGTRVVVCPDHGCDPATGAHTGAPVPAVVWAAAAAATVAVAAGRPRLTERAVAGLAVVAGQRLLDSRGRRGGWAA